MQTPAGFELRDGVAFPTDWWAIIFNASFPYRFFHVLIASGLTAGFLMAGISAYRLLKGDKKRAPHVALKTAILLVATLAPLQAFVGDLHGLNTLEHQPQKVAVMEGIWETQKGAPLLLFAVPDEEQRKNHYEVAIPNLASLILTHKADGELQGLNDFIDEHPPVKLVFYGFRIMVGLGMLMILVSWYFAYALLGKKTLSPLSYKVLVAMTFSGWLATLAGWYVTEIGRQPYLVSGVLKTAEAVTTVASSNVVFSLAIYLIVYAFLLWAYIHTVFLMARRAVDVEEFETADPSMTGLVQESAMIKGANV